MKTLKHILIKFTQSLIELIFLLPVILVVSISLLPSNRLLMAISLLPVFYLAGIILCSILKTRHKAFYLFSTLIIACISSLSVFGLKEQISSFLFFLMTSISVYRGIHTARSSWMKNSPLILFGYEIAVYFVAYVLFLVVDIYKPYLNILTAGGIASIFLFLLVCNFDQLKLAVFSDGDKSYIPSSLLRSNLTFFFIAFISILVLSRFKQFWNFIWMLLKQVFDLIYMFLSFMASFLEGSSSLSPVSSSQDFVQKGSNSFLSMIIGIIFDLITLIIVLVAAFLVIYAVIRLILKFTHWLSEMFNIDEMETKNLGYIDEKESLYEKRINYFGKLKNILLKKNKKELSWKDLKDNRERIRYIFRRTVIKCGKMGYVFKNWLTPGETGRELDELYAEKGCNTEDLVVLYNNARYGIDDISDDDVEKVSQIL